MIKTLVRVGILNTYHISYLLTAVTKHLGKATGQRVHLGLWLEGMHPITAGQVWWQEEAALMLHPHSGSRQTLFSPRLHLIAWYRPYSL